MRIDNYNRDTLEAIQETLDIENGVVEAKRYKSVDELLRVIYRDLENVI